MGIYYKLFLSFLFFIFILGFSSLSQAEEKIEIFVEEERLELDQQPFIDENNRIQVPVRFVSEALEAEVNWDDQKQEVIIEHSENTITLTIGSKTYHKNENNAEMDTSPVITDNDRTVVPLRFVSEALGRDVEWDRDERSVYISAEAEEEDKITNNPDDISVEKVEVTGSTLNVRDAPGTDNPKFDQVHAGERLEIIDRHTIEEDVEYVEWFLVDLSEEDEIGEDSGETIEGWISADYVDIIEPKTQEAEEETPSAGPSEPIDYSLEVFDVPDEYSGTMGQVTIGDSNLNVRTGPGLEYASITQVDEDETYPLITQSEADNHPKYNEWIKLRLNDGTKGWSAAEYTKETVYDNELDEINFIDWAENENNTEIRMGPVKRTYVDDFTMDNPERLVFDLEGLSLADNIREEIEVNNDTIKRIRSGFMEEKNASRVVFDLKQKEHYTIRWEDSHLVLRVFDDSPLEGKRIIIDPGHGGNDTGAESPGGLPEKEVVLDVSLMVRDMLEDLGADIQMTRETDKAVSLDDRVDFATENNGGVFVSVHANAHPSRSIKGTETFYSSERSPLDFHLASYLQDSLLNNLGTYNRGVKDRRFRVLRNATMPAALVEIAFLTNEEEEKLLRDDEFREKAAEGITQGLLNYHRNNDL